MRRRMVRVANCSVMCYRLQALGLRLNHCRTGRQRRQSQSAQSLPGSLVSVCIAIAPTATEPSLTRTRSSQHFAPLPQPTGTWGAKDYGDESTNKGNHKPLATSPHRVRNAQNGSNWLRVSSACPTYRSHIERGGDRGRRVRSAARSGIPLGRCPPAATGRC